MQGQRGPRFRWGGDATRKPTSWCAWDPGDMLGSPGFQFSNLEILGETGEWLTQGTQGLQGASRPSGKIVLGWYRSWKTGLVSSGKGRIFSRELQSLPTYTQVLNLTHLLLQDPRVSSFPSQALFVTLCYFAYPSTFQTTPLLGSRVTTSNSPNLAENQRTSPFSPVHPQSLRGHENSRSWCLYSLPAIP